MAVEGAQSIKDLSIKKLLALYKYKTVNSANPLSQED